VSHVTIRVDSWSAHVPVHSVLIWVVWLEHILLLRKRVQNS
jgi:hypothetical protein